MKLIRNSILLVVLLQAFTVSALIEVKDKILELDLDTFKEAITTHKLLCICFYAQNSRMSNEFHSVYKQLREEMKKEKNPIEFARVDVTKHNAVHGEAFIPEVPMVKFYKMGRHYDFGGPKELKHLKAFLNLALNSPLTIATPKELDDLKKRGTVIIGCFPGNAPADGYKNFQNVSEQFITGHHIPIARFAVITKASVSRDVGLVKGSITVFKHFEPNGKAVYDGSLSSVDDMLEFCEQEAQPIVFPFGHDEFSRKMLTISIKYKHLLFISPSDSKFPEIFNNFKEAAKEFRRNINNIEVMFIFVDTSRSDLLRTTSFFHVNPEKDFPCNRITVFDKYHSKFIPNLRDMSKQGFVDFTRDVMAGKVPRSVRSQELPEDWDKYPVKVLVGVNYEEVAHQNKIVLIMFYVPGHKESEEKLAVIDEVGLQFRLNKTVTIATLNVKDNDAETGVHHSYPSFRLYTMDNKEIKFKGKHNAEALIQFIESNGDVQLGALPHVEEHEEEEFLDGYMDDSEEIDYESEEERQRLWEIEEREMREQAGKLITGNNPEEDEGFKILHNQVDHASSDDIVRSHEHMDPKAHANFGDSSQEEYMPNHATTHYGDL